MLNRKSIRSASPAANRARVGKQAVRTKPPVVRRRFVLPTAKRKDRPAAPPVTNGNGHSHVKADPKSKADAKSDRKPMSLQDQTAAAAHSTTSGVDLTETIKTLLHLAQEHGYVTYDDINDILPENLSPEDLDALFSKLRSLDVEIVDQKEVERTAAK